MPGALRRAGGTASPGELTGVAAAPDTLTLKRNRDLDGRGWHPWVRRGLMLLVSAVGVLALVNVFGQHPSTATASAPAATLRLYAPTHLRGGLLYMARFRVTAHQDLKQARLVLDPGWAESNTINTIEPSPIDEASDNGKLSFTLGHIPAGKSFVLFMEFQMNPTNVGRHRQDVALYDNKTKLLVLHRTTTVFP
jgi:hypothetical protein